MRLVWALVGWCKEKVMMRNQSHLYGVGFLFKKENLAEQILGWWWMVRSKRKMMDINVPKAHTMDEEGKLKWFVLAYFDPQEVNLFFIDDDKHKKCSFLWRKGEVRRSVVVLFLIFLYAWKVLLMYSSFSCSKKKMVDCFSDLSYTTYGFFYLR